MTFLLAIETATPQVGVALVGDAGPLVVTRIAGGRRHGELLAPTISSALATAGITAAELTGIAVDVGPGLFTGLRVGVATAQALASALEVPAVGVSSLEALAHPHRRSGTRVVSVVDARRHEVFRAVYAPGGGGGGGGLVEVVAPGLVTPDALAGELAAAGETVLAVGDGALRYAEQLSGPLVGLGGHLDAHPDPAVVAELAVTRLGAAGDGPAAALRAVYLRGADVRIGWEQRDPPEGAGRG